MKATFAIAGAALAGLLGMGASQATTVTFDDLSAPTGVLSSFSDMGLDFTNNGTYMLVWDGSSPNSNGTNNNIFAGFSSSDYETITKTGGGTFTLDSIDLAISWYDSNPTETITINGSPLTITQTLTTYTLNLVGVTAVNISGVPSDSGYWTADNIVYNAVPEPSTWAMIMLGFAGLGFAGYRASRKSVALAA
jgi:hypothetical protein